MFIGLIFFGITNITGSEQHTSIPSKMGVIFVKK